MVTLATKTLDKASSTEMNVLDKSQFKALDNASAEANIKKIKSNGRALRTLAHQTAVGILMHYEKTGDYTKFTGLMSAIRSAFGANNLDAFQRWVLFYSALEYDTKLTNPTGDTKVKGNFVHKKGNGKKNNVNDAIITSFFEMERPAPVAGPFDLQKAVQSLIATAKLAAAESRLQNGDAMDDLLSFAHEHNLYITEEEKAAQKEMEKAEKARLKEEAKKGLAAADNAHPQKAESSDTTKALKEGNKKSDKVIEAIKASNGDSKAIVGQVKPAGEKKTTAKRSAAKKTTTATPVADAPKEEAAAA